MTQGHDRLAELPRAEMPDSALAVRWLQGDQGAFRELYGRYAPVVARRLRRVLGRSDEVEDVLQMTFLEVHRSLPRYRADAPFGAWLHGIAVNVTGRHLRSRRRRSWLAATPQEQVQRSADQDSPSSEEQVLRKQRAELLYRAMEDLPPKKRIAFALHEIEGMGLVEIGAVVGATPQTVWARVQSAREIVAKRLERWTARPTPAVATEGGR